MKYIPALDGLRGVAILAVLLGHASIVSAGFLGVDVFFTLSGFLITSILLKEHETAGIHLSNFYYRRALRLLPALLVVAAFCSIFFTMPPNSVLAAIFYFSNWYGALGHNQGALGHTWSLSVEEQFYMIWPLCLIGLLKSCRRRATIVTLLIIVSVLIAPYRWWLWNDHATIYRIYPGLDTRADSLLIGCALAVARLRGLAFPNAKKAGPIAFVILCILFFTGPYHGLSFKLLGLFSLVPLLTCPLILWAFSAPRLLSWQPLVFLGKISYGVYLWHFPINLLIVGQMERFSWRFLSAIVCSIAVATASFFLIEKPFLRLKDRGLPPLRRQQQIPDRDEDNSGRSGVVAAS